MGDDLDYSPDPTHAAHGKSQRKEVDGLSLTPDLNDNYEISLEELQQIEVDLSLMTPLVNLVEEEFSDIDALMEEVEPVPAVHENSTTASNFVADTSSAKPPTFDHLKNCKTEDEFLDKCKPSELAEIDNKTLFSLTGHLMKNEPKSGKWSTLNILHQRKLSRNRLAAQKSKNKKREMMNALKTMLQAIAKDYKRDKEVISRFSPETQETIIATLREYI